MPSKIVIQCGALIAAMLLPMAFASAQTETLRVFQSQDGFDDVIFDVENGIVNRGYVADYVAHIGDMLERTAEDVGAEHAIYSDARTYQFCSAVLSRKAMERDPNAIAFCPYAIFVYERADRPGTVYVGYRPLPVDSTEPNDPLVAVNEVLEAISRDATGPVEN